MPGICHAVIDGLQALRQLPGSVAGPQVLGHLPGQLLHRVRVGAHPVPPVQPLLEPPGLVLQPLVLLLKVQQQLLQFLYPGEGGFGIAFLSGLCYSFFESIHCGQRRPLAVSANTTVRAFGCFLHVNFEGITTLEAHIYGPRSAVRLKLDCHTDINSRAVDNGRSGIGQSRQTCVLVIFLACNQSSVLSHIRRRQRGCPQLDFFGVSINFFCAFLIKRKTYPAILHIFAANLCNLIHDHCHQFGCRFRCVINHSHRLHFVDLIQVRRKLVLNACEVAHPVYVRQRKNFGLCAVSDSRSLRKHRILVPDVGPLHPALLGGHGAAAGGVPGLDLAGGIFVQVRRHHFQAGARPLAVPIRHTAPPVFGAGSSGKSAAERNSLRHLYDIFSPLTPSFLYLILLLAEKFPDPRRS